MASRPEHAHRGRGALDDGDAPQPLTVAPPSNDQLVIAGKTFNSRLFLGTGKYKTAQDMADSIAASEAEVVTVAVRRVEGAVTSMLETSIDWNKVWLLPNTAGCTTAEDAVRVARLGREVAKTLGQDDNNFVKLEVITDSTYLLPDPVGTLAAARQLVRRARYYHTARRTRSCVDMQDIGCATVMPWAHRSFRARASTRRRASASSSSRRPCPSSSTPASVPSDAALAMELGADAYLANSAVARADERAGDGARLQARDGGGPAGVHRAAHGHLEDGRGVIAAPRHIKVVLQIFTSARSGSRR